MAAVGLAFVVELARALVAPTGSPGGLLTDAMVVVILTLPVVAFSLRAADQSGGRIGWALIGVGLALNSLGEGWFFFAQAATVASGSRLATSSPPRIRSLAGPRS